MESCFVTFVFLSPHILRSAAYVRGYGDSVFQTHGGMGLSFLASPTHTPLRCVCTGYRDSVFQTHWGMGLSILASPRTNSAPLCMYGVTEIASSRRMGLWVSLSLHPRTYSAPLRMYGVTEIASSRRMGLLDSISKFFIPHSSFIIFNFNSLCPVKNKYICKNKLNVKR